MLHEDIQIRRFNEISDLDKISKLTRLLNEAYKPLAEMGFRYMGSYQDDQKTKERIGLGTCLIATKKEELIGTILYRPPGKAGGNSWYLAPGVATIGQFAVKAAYQKNGIGTKLIQQVIELAKHDNVKELALDTSEGATHLINYYNHLGFVKVGYCQWEDTNYKSVIMSKTLIY
jgi:GNAT superfamily N-acetyltransferase